MKSRLRSLRRFGSGVVLLAAAVLASGYDLIREGASLVTWNSGAIPIVLRLPTETTFQDGTSHTTSVTAALADWNAQLANVQFSHESLAPGSADDNGINEVVFAADIYGFDGRGPTAFGANVLAVTISYRSGAEREDGSFARVESDVIFNSNAFGGWNSYRGNLQSAQDIRRVAIHEFGHVLGLNHPDQNNQSVYAIMNSSVTFIDALRPDDINGAQFQYGRPGGFSAPANDNFASAATLTLNGTSLVLTTESIGASRETGEPQHGPGNVEEDPGSLGGASVWWRWTATAGGTLLVSTSESLFDTMLAAYTGNSLATLTQLASNDDVQAGLMRTSSISIPVVYGETYFFAVDGWAGEWGEIKLSVSVVDVITPPFIVTEPADRTISVGQSSSMTVGATGAAPLAYRWQVSVGGTEPWTELSDDALHTGTATAELTFPAAANDARNRNAYRCVVTNTGGRATSAAATLTINRLAQEIDFPVLTDRAYSPAPITLTATASSGLPVSFARISGPATLDGAQLTLTGIGTITLLATQPGNSTYAAAASEERTFAVTKGAATVTLGGLGKTYTGTPQTVSVNTTPANLTVNLTYNGAATAPTNAGSYAIAAVVNDALYQGTAEGTLVIDRAAQTITFASLSDRAFTTAPIALSATSSSGLSVSFSVSAGPARVDGTNLVLEGTGNITVRASQSGGSNHFAAPDVERSFTVAGNFSSWQREHFTADELLDAAISGPAADPDHDGFANLLEYALGLDPRGAAAQQEPAVTSDGEDWIFTYTRPAQRSDVDYAVEATHDLATWDVPIATHARIAEGATETWQARVPRAAGSKLFFRLRASLSSGL